MRNTFTLIFLFILFQLTFLQAESQTRLNGAFAGSDFVPNVSGMMRYDYSYYLRPDGSFASALEKTDWKTRVDGHYTVTGKSVKLNFKSGSSDSYSLTDGGYLFSGTTNLFKYDPGNMNEIPAHTFEYTSASSMGGTGTDMPYTGGYGKNFLALDGKGNFSHSSFGSGSVVSPDFSHGSFKESKGDGAYTLKDGLLTLKYNDGKVVTKSFFYSGGKTPSALINGNVYWVMKGDDIKTENTKEKLPAPKPDGAKNVNGQDILKKANLAHGGAKLDQLKTARLKAKMGDLQITMLLDFNKGFIRTEYNRNNQLIAVEQSENQNGWQWVNGKTSSISAARNQELQETFHSGMLALRSGEIKNRAIKSAETNEQGIKTVYFNKGAADCALIFDTEYRLVGEVTVLNGKQQSAISSDFRTVGGILVPFLVKDNRDGKETAVVYSSVDVNIALEPSDWQKK